MPDPRKWLLRTTLEADADELQTWNAYYTQRLAEEGRAPGQPIDTYYEGGKGPGVVSPVFITDHYMRAARSGAEAAVPVDDFVRVALNVNPLLELTTEQLPLSLRTVVGTVDAGALETMAAIALTMLAGVGRT